jgi:hypothetical protein
MYVKNLGRLGQTPNANTQFVAGANVSLQFTLDTAASAFWSSSITQDVQNSLAGWAPFSSGAFSLQSVSIDDPSAPTVLTVSFSVGANGAQYTYGLLASSIASIVNGSITGTVTPTLAAGLATTTTLQQFEQQGGVTVSPFAPVSPGQPSWEQQLIGQLFPGAAPSGKAPSPTALPSWVWWAAAALGLLGAAAYFH